MYYFATSHSTTSTNSGPKSLTMTCAAGNIAIDANVSDPGNGQTDNYVEGWTDATHTAYAASADDDIDGGGSGDSWDLDGTIECIGLINAPATAACPGAGSPCDGADDPP